MYGTTARPVTYLQHLREQLEKVYDEFEEIEIRVVIRTGVHAWACFTPLSTPEDVLWISVHEMLPDGQQGTCAHGEVTAVSNPGSQESTSGRGDRPSLANL